jgi:hypothetical protein
MILRTVLSTGSFDLFSVSNCLAFFLGEVVFFEEVFGGVFLEARTLRRLKRCCRDFKSSVKSAGRDEMKIGVELSTGRVGWLSSRTEAAAGEAEEEYLAHWG